MVSISEMTDFSKDTSTTKYENGHIKEIDGGQARNRNKKIDVSFIRTIRNKFTFELNDSFNKYIKFEPYTFLKI